jgi:hypothetical protein
MLGPMAVLISVPPGLMPPAVDQLPDCPVTQFLGFITTPDGPPPRA